MKNQIVLFILLCPVLLPLGGQEDNRSVRFGRDGQIHIEEYTLRRTRWGMTPQQVKQNEAAALERQNDTMLAYKVKLDYLDMALTYHFRDNRLYKAAYKHNTPAGEAEMYYLLVPLTHKYGHPLFSRKKFNKSGRYRFFQATWITKTTIIRLTFYSGFQVIIGYYDRDRVKIDLPRKKRRPLIRPDDI
jgi:hypothetical protein